MTEILKNLRKLRIEVEHVKFVVIYSRLYLKRQWYRRQQSLKMGGARLN